MKELDVQSLPPSYDGLYTIRPAAVPPVASARKSKLSSNQIKSLICMLLIFGLGLFMSIYAGITLNAKCRDLVETRIQEWSDRLHARLATYEPCMCRLHNWSDRLVSFTASCPSGVFSMDADYEGRPIRRADIDQDCLRPSGEDLPYFGTGDDFLQDQVIPPLFLKPMWSELNEHGFEGMFGIGILLMGYAIVIHPFLFIVTCK